ncbi:hypothetical protein PT2222_130330 [Paraburkholderia tropica]
MILLFLFISPHNITFFYLQKEKTLK